MNWFKSYLTDRQQTTIVRNIPSTPLNVKCGVPQGSVLGPTLLLIFINLSKSLKWSKDNFFADDVVIYTSGDEKDEEVNDDIANLHTWCIQNAITMNVKKTKYMSFGTRQRLNLCSQNTETLYNKTLEKADSCCTCVLSLVRLLCGAGGSPASLIETQKLLLSRGL